MTHLMRKDLAVHERTLLTGVVLVVELQLEDLLLKDTFNEEETRFYIAELVEESRASTCGVSTQR